MVQRVRAPPPCLKQGCPLGMRYGGGGIFRGEKFAVKKSDPPPPKIPPRSPQDPPKVPPRSDQDPPIAIAPHPGEIFAACDQQLHCKFRCG